LPPEVFESENSEFFIDLCKKALEYEWRIKDSGHPISVIKNELSFFERKFVLPDVMYSFEINNQIYGDIFKELSQKNVVVFETIDDELCYQKTKEETYISFDEKSKCGMIIEIDREDMLSIFATISKKFYGSSHYLNCFFAAHGCKSKVKDWQNFHLASLVKASAKIIFSDLETFEPTLSK
jgi:hypothetical protein